DRIPQDRAEIHGRVLAGLGLGRARGLGPLDDDDRHQISDLPRLVVRVEASRARPKGAGRRRPNQQGGQDSRRDDKRELVTLESASHAVTPPPAVPARQGTTASTASTPTTRAWSTYPERLFCTRTISPSRPSSRATRGALTHTGPAWAARVTARPFHTSGTRSTVPAASTVPGDSGLTARQPAGSSEAGTSPRGTEVNSRTSRATVVRSSTWWRTTGVWTTHTSTDQRVSQRTAIVRWGTPSTLATTATTMVQVGCR